MELRQELKPKLSQQVTPQIITAQTLLHCSNQEIEEAVLHEMEENPALDWDDKKEKELQFFASPSDKTPSSFSREREELPPLEQKVDPERAFKNELLFQAHVHALDDLQEPVERLIEQLDATGYFSVPLEQLAKKWKAPLSTLEAALIFLQSLEPPGVGARSAQECLLLQLRQWSKEEIDLVEKVLKEAWDDFLHLRKQRIAETFKLSSEAVEDIFRFIQKKLTLYPGYGFASPAPQAQALIPDIIIEEKQGEFIPIVVEQRSKPLRVSPLYYQLFKKIKRYPDSFTPQEKQHIYHYLERTKNFLRALESRREMLLTITKTLLEFEKRFLQTQDKKEMPPLTQSELARACGVSESTISRAASSKSIQLPWGTVVPISFFLSPNKVIKEKLLFLLLKENPKKPLPDQKVSEIFRSVGVRLSRRTIAKYREELGIPPTPIRRRMGEEWKERFREK